MFVKFCAITALKITSPRRCYNTMVWILEIMFHSNGTIKTDNDYGEKQCIIINKTVWTILNNKTNSIRLYQCHTKNNRFSVQYIFLLQFNFYVVLVRSPTAQRTMIPKCGRRSSIIPRIFLIHSLNFNITNIYFNLYIDSNLCNFFL